MFVNRSGQNVQFGQAVSEKIFENRPIKNKICLWRPCLLTDQYEICNLYREHSIDVSYQVSVHLARWFYRTTDDGRQVIEKAHIDFGKMS
jgi:hypothetical protein